MFDFRVDVHYKVVDGCEDGCAHGLELLVVVLHKGVTFAGVRDEAVAL